jgi:glycyl-tRNA synthetase beta chain
MEDSELALRFAVALTEGGVEFEGLEAMSTPRRAVVWAKKMEPVQLEREETVMGPPVRIAYADGAPTKAMEGFLRTNGVRLEDVRIVSTDKGEYVSATKRTGSEPTLQVLARTCPEIVAGLPFPKRMRWGDGQFSYSRPIRWILALFGDQVIPFTLGDVASGRTTYGHRIHGPGPHVVADAADWQRVMKDVAMVVPKAAARRAIIVEQGDRQAEAVNGGVLWKDSLLDEVQGLVEHPVAMLGSFDGKYLEVPREVLLTSMETHQKSFGVEGPDGRLMPHFLTVLNMTPKDDDIVRKGWERVLRARLEDARFFWKTDLAENFDLWLKKLDGVIFLRKLGSVGDKTRRLERLCRFLADQCAPGMQEVAARAGRISKADLVTGLVGEFDSLQGVMGGIYAARMGEPPEVAEALREQYLPAGPDTPLPASIVGALLSIADKADTLTGCFALNMVPTGAADPNGLRRCALGIIRIALHFGFDVEMDQLFALSLDLHDHKHMEHSRDVVLGDLMEFLKGRLRNHFQGRYNTLLVDAALGPDVTVLPDCLARLEALEAFSHDPEYAGAVLTFKRVANILHKQTAAVSDVWQDGALQEAPERELAAAFKSLLPRLDDLWKKRDHGAALSLLHEIRPQVDAFFDGVMVMCDDEGLRMNRLGLLKALESRFARIADFAALQI